VAIKLTNFVDLNPKEIQMVLEWRNHISVRKWMLNKQEISLQEHLDYIDSLKKSSDKLYFLVKTNKEYIGVVDFKKIDFYKKEACFGLYANPDLKGVGSRLVSFSIKYIFDILQLDKIIIEVFADNYKAISLYEKFNFEIFEEKILNSCKVVYMKLDNE